MIHRSAAFLAVLFVYPLSAHPASTAGLSFQHQEWQLVCDNTRTCRAAGYHEQDGSDHAVSVLLTRKAGPNQPIIGKLMLGEYGENEVLKQMPNKFKLRLRINDRPFGTIPISKDSLTADLPAAQVTALLAALSRDSRIE